MVWSCKTPCDYIEKSLTIHPTMFVEAMSNVATVHEKFAASTYSNAARDIALKLRHDCMRVARIASFTGLDHKTPRFQAEYIVSLGMAVWIPAFYEAARLNCMRQHAASIAAEYPDGK